LRAAGREVREIDSSTAAPEEIFQRIRQSLNAHDCTKNGR
jgi:hypothetical protein